MKFFQKKDICKRVMSMALAIVMVFTMFAVKLPGGLLTVKAETTDTYVTLHLKVDDNIPGGQDIWTDPTIQFWGGSSTEVSDSTSPTGGEDIGTWGVKGYKLTAEVENAGWYKVTLKGDFTGFQFVNDMTNPDGGKAVKFDPISKYSIDSFKGETPTDIYCICDTNNQGAWYTDREGNDILTVQAPTNVTLNIQVDENIPGGTALWTAPAIQFWGGSSTEVSNSASPIGGENIGTWGVKGYKLTADTENAGWYYVTLKGDFSGFQFLNDMSNPDGGKTVKFDSISASGINLYTDTYPTDLYCIYKNNKWAFYKDKDGLVGAKSANITMHIRVDENIPGGAALWTAPAIQFWGDASTVASNGETLLDSEPINGWGVNGYKLIAEDDNWYKVTLKGNFTGFQFLNDMSSPDGNKTVKFNSSAETGIRQYMEDTPKDVYCIWKNNKWAFYTDKNGEYPVLGDSAEPDFTTATITIHFRNSENWNEVYAYITQSSSWSAISGYGYAGAYPGAAVNPDSNNEGWYSFTITMPVDQFNCIFNNSLSGSDEVKTGDITFTPSKENTEKWVYFTTNGGAPTITETAPSGWVASTSGAPVKPSTGITSPIVNADNTVTVSLDATGAYADAESVNLMGTLKGTDWSTGLPMSLSSDGKTYTVTTPVQTPGVYGYKFKINGSTWIIDPSNEYTTADGNSKVVISGLENKEIDAKRGEATALPDTLNLYDADGNVTPETPVYALKDTSLADVVTIADGKITVAAGTTMDKVVLTASAKGTTSEVTVNVKDFVCNYTVYYYDYDEAHRTTTAADVHVWEVGGGDIGNFAFNKLETLSDDNQWLKATFTSSATNIGLIPRSAGAWIWQTGNHYYENTAKAENVTIYIVFGDDANTYTSLPEIKELRDRYAVIEYERSDSDYTGWNIYTWNSGFGSAVSKEIKDNNGKQDAIIPVYDVSTDFTLGFCMRKSEADNEWAKKDGGDHYLLIPADQLVVKAKFIQDKGIVEILPYNTGYEMDAANDQIHFYYRDDELFKNNKEATLEGKVQVVIDGQAHAMAYDAANERYYYDAKGLTSGNHEYYYVVNGETKPDAFNAKTNADETASVLTYKKFDNLGISATMYYPTMTYNDNNVVMVKLTGDDAANLTKSEIVSVKVDCSALGTGTLDIVPQLMEGTISCLSTVKAGVKTLPVTLKDIYGNVCNTTVDVTVTDRTASTDDFDWDQSVIYFTVTDRFFDGSTANNSGVDKDGSLSYHGGDFAGLQAKLDYLQDLGINTIWITPIVANSDTVTDKEGEEIESTGYHGYWASDFTKLNSHLGTEEEFAALIKEVHAHGMKLMVDVVVNHAGYNTESYFNSILVDDATGESIAMIRDASNSVTGSDVYGSLAGLPDFVTENEEVRNQLIEWQVDWITKYDIDYFRVDTVKHVDTATWKAFKNALIKQNQDFKMIGEEAGSGYASNSVNLGTGSMDALLDFDTNGWMADYLTGNISSVESSMVKRNGAINNTRTLGQFLNSHDEDGLLYTLQKEKKLTEHQAADLMKVAATMTLTAKGIPVIYYGEEIGLYGQNNYPYQTNRYDMDWALAAKQQADASSIYNHYKTMLGIRKEYSQLFAKGNRVTVKASNEEGYDVFSRSYGDTTLYIGTNIKSEAKTVQIPVGGDKNTTYTDLYSNTLYVVNENGMLDITIPAASKGGTVILVKTEKEVPSISDKPGTSNLPDIEESLSEENTTSTPSRISVPVKTASETQNSSDEQNEETQTTVEEIVVEEVAEEVASEDTQIAEEETPLAAGTEATNGNVVMIILIIALLGVAAGSVVVLKKKNFITR